MKKYALLNNSGNQIKNNRGFTLVELLTIMVILSMLVAIIVPSVNGIIEKNRKESFETNAKSLIRQAIYEKTTDVNFDLTQINKENIKELLSVSGKNYDIINFEERNGKVFLKVKGSDKWSGLSACGSYEYIEVVDGDCELELESILPTIAFGTNGNSTWAKTRGTTVTVSDNVAVDTNSLKYRWTTSTVQPSEDAFTTSFTNGESINSPAGVTGEYYLWVLGKDIVGNTKISRSNIFKLDNTPPVITMNGNNPVDINVDSVYSDLGATASDDHSGINGSVQSSSNVNTSVAGAYTITYNITDKAGNAATQVVRTVNVQAISYASGNKLPIAGTGGSSTHPPAGWTSLVNASGDDASVNVPLPFNIKMFGNSYNSFYFGSNGYLTFGGGSSTYSSLSATTPALDKIHFGGADNSYQRVSYYSTDGYVKARYEGSASTSGTLGSPTIVVEFTFINPNKTVDNRTIIEMRIGNHARLTGAAMIANANGSASVPYTLAQSTSYVFVGDSNGNNFQVYNSYHSTLPEPPRITMLGNDKVFLEVGQSYTDAGATAVDYDGNNITSNIQVTSNLNINIEGWYTVTYNVVDSKGTPSVPVTRNIRVGEPPTPEICFTFNSGTHTITSYDANCGGTDVVIPETINGVTVTTTDTSAFYQKNLTSLVIPNTMVTIGSGSFGYNKLTSVTIPSGVRNIVAAAFQYNNLTSVTFLNGVTTIGNNAFEHNSITSLTLPTSLTTIGSNAFGYNDISSLTIPSSVTSIDGQAFNDNQLPDGQAIIYARNANGTINTSKIVSYGGSRRSGIVIPEGVTTLEHHSFVGNSITSLTLPSTLTTIGTYAFPGNSLTSINIPSGVTRFESDIFNGNSLTSLTIPSGVTYIGSNAFNGNNITSLTIPSGVTYIGADAFTGNELTTVAIPNGVTTLGTSAFENNNLTSVTIGTGITSLGTDVFRDNALTSVTIPSNITSIGGYAFYTNNLTSINIPSTVTSIGTYAFYNNDLTSVTIPSTITTINSYTFANNNIASITIPTSVTTIGDRAFYTNNLTSINIPTSVKTIGSYTFAYNSLTSATIPLGVTSLGTYAFYQNALTSIAIPNSVTSIGSYAFRYNKILQGSATIDNSSANVTIGSYAFASNGSGGTTTITPVFLR